MLRNASSSSRISFESRDADSIEKAFAGRMSFEPTKFSCLGPIIGSVSNNSLADTAIAEYDSWREHHCCALEHFDRIASEAVGKLVAVFLDYDGTLTPIVSNPDAAFMSEEMRSVVRQVAELFPTAIVSGRGREKVENFVQLKELYYAGSHGMDIVGPQVAGREAEDVAFQAAAQYAPLMDLVFKELEEGVRGIPGSSVEHNKFCVSVHFRNCSPGDWPAVVAAVDAVAAASPDLKVTRGRKVLEVRPQVNWDKGSALSHLMGELGLADPGSVLALYIGDDRTDEDAFKVLAERRLGSGILVSTKVKLTAAHFTLRDPAHVQQFLGRLVEWGGTGANLWHVHGGCKGWTLKPGAQQAQQTDKQPCATAQAACSSSGWGAANGSGGAAGSRSAGLQERLACPLGSVSKAGLAQGACPRRLAGASAASKLSRQSPQAAATVATVAEQQQQRLGEGVRELAECNGAEHAQHAAQAAGLPEPPGALCKMAAASSLFSSSSPPVPALGGGDALLQPPPPPATPAMSASEEGLQGMAPAPCQDSAAAVVAAGLPR